MEKIPITENGLEACWKREVQLHPTDAKGSPFPWWKRRAETEHLIVGDVNALIDVETRQDGQIATLIERVTALEAAPAVPFPLVSG